MSNELTVRNELKYELSVEEVISHVQKVHQVMAKAMQEGHHYGVIPGTKSKPTLLKPGAELICVMFRLGPRYRHETIREDNGHITITCTCELWHTPTNTLQGEGMASCSTHEAKYAWRKGSIQCPVCECDSIIRGKEEYGGGWLCWKKKGGCGQQFRIDDHRITGQSTDRVPNEDLADSYNTVLKMASKRALVAAVLTATAASDIFTQDIEDFTPPEPAKEAPKAEEPKSNNAKYTKENMQERIKALDVYLEHLGCGPESASIYVDSIRERLGIPASFSLCTQQQINALVEELKVFRIKKQSEAAEAKEIIDGLQQPLAEVEA